MDAYQGDPSERSPQGPGGYQTKSRRDEKMPARKNESNKSDVGMQSGRMHSQKGSSGDGAQDKKVDPTSSNQGDKKVRNRSPQFPFEICHGKDRLINWGLNSR